MSVLDSFGVGKAFREPAECIININGQELWDLYPFIREVRVKMSRKAPAECTLVFDTVRDEMGIWSVQDSRLLGRWKKIVIIASFSVSNTKPVMTGYIQDIKTDLPSNMGEARVTVTGKDESVLLDRMYVKKNPAKEKSPKTDKEIIEMLCENTIIKPGKVKTGLTNKSLNIDEQPVRFIQKRAEVNGYEFYVRDGSLHFHSPDLKASPDTPPILVYAGPATNCLRISIQEDAHKPDCISVTFPAEKGTTSPPKEFKPDLKPLGAMRLTSDDLGLPPFAWDLKESSISKEEACARAQAKANENSWKITAEGELDGSLYGDVLLTHTLVRVDGVGQVHGGLYYVDEVNHVFSSEGYRQSFRLIRNATG